MNYSALSVLGISCLCTLLLLLFTFFTIFTVSYLPLLLKTAQPQLRPFRLNTAPPKNIVHTLLFFAALFLQHTTIDHHHHHLGCHHHQHHHCPMCLQIRLARILKCQRERSRAAITLQKQPQNIRQSITKQNLVEKKFDKKKTFSFLILYQRIAFIKAHAFNSSQDKCTSSTTSTIRKVKTTFSFVTEDLRQSIGIHC